MYFWENRMFLLIYSPKMLHGFGIDAAPINCRTFLYFLVNNISESIHFY